MSKRSIEATWLEFKRRVYPNGMLPDQERQLRDAFYAGAGAAFESISYASRHHTEEEAMRILDGFHREIIEYAGRIGLRGRKN